MKMGIFGTGVVGQTIAEKLTELGHQAMIGTRDVIETMSRTENDNFGRPAFKEWQTNNPKVKLGTFNEAASFGELILNATNGVGTMPALKAAGKQNLSGKVMLDISNPLDFSKGMPPSLFVCNTDSLGEQIQKAYPDVKVVKSLNTVNAYVMVSPGLLPEDSNIFVCGNDGDAKLQIKLLLQSFGWKENYIIDMGDITNSRGVEMWLPMWVRLWGAMQNPMFNMKIVVGG